MGSQRCRSPKPGAARPDTGPTQPYTAQQAAVNEGSAPAVTPRKQPLSGSRPTVQSWAMRLPPGRELEVMDLVYEQGRADGAAWAARQQQLDRVGIFEGRGGADDARHAPGSRELSLASES